MIKLNYKKTRFITSANNVNYLPKDIGIEIAFFGYSNTGKSSAINALTHQKKLAYTSKLPGSTKFINLFEITVGKYLVDLPGYGYARMRKNTNQKLQKLFSEYLKKRLCLKGMIIFMDIRHPLKSLDKQIIQQTVKKIPVLVLLTKSDKLNSFEKRMQLNKVKKWIFAINVDVQIEIFSSLKRQGVDKLQQNLNKWYNNDFF